METVSKAQDGAKSDVAGGSDNKSATASPLTKAIASANATRAATPTAKAVLATPTKPIGPPFRIKSLSDTKRYWKMLFYGVHGAGKTELAGSACDVPEWSDVFIVAAEKGEMTLEDTDRIKSKDNIFPAACDNISEVSKMKDWLLAHCRARDANDEVKLKELEVKLGWVHDGPAKRFNTVIVDTVTEIQAFATYQSKGYGSNMAIDATLLKTGWDNFNEILDRVEIFMRAFRDLPIHVIFLAQEQYVQDENKAMIKSPALQGQMSRRIQGFVDMVGWLTVIKDEKGEKLRRLYVQPIGKFAAKNRKGSYKGDWFDDPTIPKMLAQLGSPAVDNPTQKKASV